MSRLCEHLPSLGHATAIAASRRLRILMISHTCQSRSEGLPKAEQLSSFADLQLRVIVPDRWRHYGRWRQPDHPVDANYEQEIGAVALPWMGPAQSYLHLYPRLKRTLLEFRPDVIDLWEEPWCLVSAQACWLRNRLLPNTKIIAETEQNIRKMLPPPFGWFRSYTLANADFAVARSGGALNVLRELGYRGEAAVVPNAVDAELFHPLTPERREAIRRELGWSGLVVGCVGRLVEEKGLMDVLQAVASCPNDVRLVIVGDGPLEKRLRKRAAALLIDNRVSLLGSRAAKELPPLLGAMDAMVLASRTTRRWKEQFGRVIIEAHACGTPVIGSNSGAIPDVVGQGGIIFPEGDTAALSQAILAVRHDAARRERLGQIGRQQVEARYTWLRVAEQMRKIYVAASDGARRDSDAGRSVGAGH